METIFKIILRILLPALFLSEMVYSQSVKDYQLNGKIQGVQEGEKITAFIIDPSGHFFEKRDSGFVKNGEFIITGIVPEGPREYIIAFDKHRWSLDLLINNGEKINVVSNQNLSEFAHNYINDYVTVSGSAYYASWRMLLSSYWLYEASIINLKRKAQHLVDSIGFNGPLINQIFESIREIDNAFAVEFFSLHAPSQVNPECKVAFPMFAYTVNFNSHHAAFMINGYEQLSPEFKNSFYGKELKEYTRLCVGQPFPDFTLPTVDGGTLALKDVIKKSKLTLVHFWGASSLMKKELQDELKIFYRQYHDKGLNIVGFYSDSYGDQWKDLVKKEQYPWYNVSDLKGYEGMTAKVYHEYISPGEIASPKPPEQRIANTTNVLIDNQGRIVAWDVYGVELQWYLWKYCGDDAQKKGF